MVPFGIAQPVADQIPVQAVGPSVWMASGAAKPLLKTKPRILEIEFSLAPFGHDGLRAECDLGHGGGFGFHRHATERIAEVHCAIDPAAHDSQPARADAIELYALPDAF